MNITDCAHMARKMMNEHGLGHVPFEFGRARKTLGICWFNKHTGAVTKITLSRHFAEVLPEEELRDVMLHEIAHALAGMEANHGPEWKKIALSLGHTGDRCATPSVMPQASQEHAWHGHCPVCGKVSKMHRAPGRVKSCGRCVPKKFSPRHIIVWSKNGHKVSINDMPSKYRAEYNSIKISEAMSWMK